MKAYARSLAYIFIIMTTVLTNPSMAADNEFNDQSDTFLDTFNTTEIQTDKSQSQQVVTLGALKLRIENCQHYPYHENEWSIQSVSSRAKNSHNGSEILIKDIEQGLRKGLQCLSGKSELGRLHPYHEAQAKKLITILKSPLTKTFRCVRDKSFAYAVAKLPSDQYSKEPDPNDITNSISYPGVVIDTYRIGGFITNKFNSETYRNFFKLNEEQIAEIANGKPVQIANMHRYKNRSSLMFHEMIHWLGHEHSSIHPDVTDLYDTCCFGGSDFISDKVKNEGFQTKACNILRDKELWEANPYKKMQLWRHKEYDQLKRTMRNHYDGY